MRGEEHGHPPGLRVPLADPAVALDDLVDAIYAGRVQNPTMVVGALAAFAALRTGRVDWLRAADADWPARDRRRQRAAELAAADERA